MNLRDKIEGLQDMWDDIMASRSKFGLFCAICGFVIGVAVAYL
jgi:hypothetical protein